MDYCYVGLFQIAKIPIQFFLSQFFGSMDIDRVGHSQVYFLVGLECHGHTDPFEVEVKLVPRKHGRIPVEVSTSPSLAFRLNPFTHGSRLIEKISHSI